MIILVATEPGADARQSDGQGVAALHGGFEWPPTGLLPPEGSRFGAAAMFQSDESLV